MAVAATEVTEIPKVYLEGLQRGKGTVVGIELPQALTKIYQHAAELLISQPARYTDVPGRIGCYPAIFAKDGGFIGNMLDSRHVTR